MGNQKKGPVGTPRSLHYCLGGLLPWATGFVLARLQIVDVIWLMAIFMVALLMTPLFFWKGARLALKETGRKAKLSRWLNVIGFGFSLAALIGYCLIIVSFRL